MITQKHISFNHKVHLHGLSSKHISEIYAFNPKTFKSRRFRNKRVQSVFAAADILRHFLYVKDILHIVYVKYKERKKENVK